MIKEFKGGYMWLSNFQPCVVELDGVYYPTVENAYQAAKTLKDRQKFTICSAGEAKGLGRKVKLRKDWGRVKIDVMKRLLQQKFECHTFLARELLDTEDEEIVEGNTWGDTYWGICNGVGENHLGKLLMEIRQELTKCQQ